MNFCVPKCLKLMHKNQHFCALKTVSGKLCQFQSALFNKFGLTVHFLKIHEKLSFGVMHQETQGHLDTYQGFEARSWSTEQLREVVPSWWGSTVIRDCSSKGWRAIHCSHSSGSEITWTVSGNCTINMEEDTICGRRVVIVAKKIVDTHYTTHANMFTKNLVFAWNVQYW